MPKATPHSEVDILLGALERKHERRLNSQRDKALAEIVATRLMLESQKKHYKLELMAIEKIIAYVRKYKFLPSSYQNMIDTWTTDFLNRFIFKSSE